MTEEENDDEITVKLGTHGSQSLRELTREHVSPEVAELTQLIPVVEHEKDVRLIFQSIRELGARRNQCFDFGGKSDEIYEKIDHGHMPTIETVLQMLEQAKAINIKWDRIILPVKELERILVIERRGDNLWLDVDTDPDMPWGPQTRVGTVSKESLSNGQKPAGTSPDVLQRLVGLY